MPSAKAQSPEPALGPWYNQTYQQWSAKVFDDSNQEVFGERYTFAQINWIMNSLVAVLTGSDISKCTATGDLAKVGECMKALKVTGMNGPIPWLASATDSLLITKPASGVNYVTEKLANLHLIPEANAQQSAGVGFNTLQPLQTIWRFSRNTAYALLVLVFLVLSFMIMFRVKISPQTVISIQSALPKIALTVVFITFSYAIAGFLIDLSYVVLGLFAAAIKTGGSNEISTQTVPYLFDQLTRGNGVWSIAIGLLIFTVLISAGVFLAGGLSFVTVGTTIPAVILLIVGLIFILLILFRLFWLMTKTAGSTILLIIAGPLALLLGAVSPSGGVGGWIKNLIGNLAVYPTVAIMIFFSHYFFWGWFLGKSGGVFAACGDVSTAFNTFCINGGDASAIYLPGAILGTPILGFMISFLLLFMIPQAANIVQAIMSGKAFSAGNALGQAVGVPIAVGNILDTRRRLLADQEMKDELGGKAFSGSLTGGNLRNAYAGEIIRFLQGLVK